jgi:tRNA U54 and U55 pseudouridine synthase Pus10
MLPLSYADAGREDIDVRMLGSGRPFILEIQNARRCIPAPEEFQRMQAAVLQVREHPKGHVREF